MLHALCSIHSSISKGISAAEGQQSYRGLVRIAGRAENARNYTQCDSLLIGDRCGAHTYPYIEVKNPTAKVEHEATTSKIGEDQLFYCRSRGLSEEDAVSLIVNGLPTDGTPAIKLGMVPPSLSLTIAVLFIVQSCESHDTLGKCG